MSSSVLSKAIQVQAESSRLLEGVSAEVEAKRVTQRLTTLMARLEELKQVVNVARRLNNEQLPERIDLTAIDSGFEAFRGKALAGPPSDRVFVSAEKKIGEVVSRLTTAVTAAWAAWTNRVIADLPVTHISMLPAEEQRPVRTRVEQLKKLAKAPMPSTSDIQLVLSTASLITDELRDVPEPRQEILDLLAKLDRRLRPTIDQITDDEIRILRESGIADQIELHRRGA